MFDKFGEFDSAEEINRSAAAQKQEGDLDAIKAIAKENGLDPEDAEDYIDNVIPELCTPLTAAIGKIKVESESIALFGELEYSRDILNMELMKDSRLQAAVRRKGKTLTGLLGQILKEASNRRKQVPSDIVKAAGLGSQTIYTGGMTKKETIDQIRKYYEVTE